MFFISINDLYFLSCNDNHLKCLNPMIHYYYFYFICKIELPWTMLLYILHVRLCLCLSLFLHACRHLIGE